MRERRLLRAAYLISVYTFVLFPFAIIIYASFNDATLVTIPPQKLSLRWYIEILQKGLYLEPLWYSIELAVSATLTSLVLGILAALALDRYPIPGRDFIGSLFLAPLTLPLVITAVGLLILFVNSPIGLGRISLWIGHTVITLPYVIRTMLSALAHFDRSLEEAAANLGAHPLRVLWHVTLPVLKPGITAAAMFAFIVSFGDTVLGLFIAGAGMTTLPVQIFADIRWDFTPAIAAISAIVSFLALGLTLVLFFLQGAGAFTGQRPGGQVPGQKTQP